jgi:hypothetical protein
MLYWSRDCRLGGIRICRTCRTCRSCDLEYDICSHCCTKCCQNRECNEFDRLFNTVENTRICGDCLGDTPIIRTKKTTSSCKYCSCGREDCFRLDDKNICRYCLTMVLRNVDDSSDDDY